MKNINKVIKLLSGEAICKIKGGGRNSSSNGTGSYPPPEPDPDIKKDKETNDSNLVW